MEASKRIHRKQKEEEVILGIMEKTVRCSMPMHVPVIQVGRTAGLHSWGASTIENVSPLRSLQIEVHEKLAVYQILIFPTVNTVYM